MVGGLLLPDVEIVGGSSSAEQAASRPGLYNRGIIDMGSVVATVTGYSGDERSNLIKLINFSGAYYVGKLLKGITTHLVCWTFDGRKYEMAKSFGIHIVNHQFFEESVKEGRRLSESAYNLLSGEQVGAVVWKPTKPESVLPGQAKLGSPKACSKYVRSKTNLTNSVPPKDLFEAVPNRKVLSPVDLQGTFPEDISDDDQDLELLLNHRPNRGDRGKRKASLILKNQSLRYKTSRKRAKKLTISPGDAGKRKHVDRKNRVTHSMLEYVYIQEELDAVNGQGSPKVTCSNRMCDEHTSDIWFSNRNRRDFTLPGAGRMETFDEEPSFPEKARDGVCCTARDIFGGSPVACTLAASDIACVICHTDQINSAEGVLGCGHSFCYQCINKWASEVASKAPLCPLCKAPFDMITKREQKIGLDAEEVSYEESVVVLGFGKKCAPEQHSDSTPRLACIMCGIGDMEELLLTCSGCGTRSAHSFCLDPPLPPVSDTPWFCGRCSQRRRADTTWWHQLHLFEE